MAPTVYRREYGPAQAIRAAVTLNNLGELPGVTSAIGTRLRHQYMLSYRPPAGKNGKWQKINVKIRLPRKVYALLHVQARSGYYAMER